MNEMIERLYKVAFIHFTENDNVGYLTGDERQKVRSMVINIVKAMREPTEEMLDAGSAIGPSSCQYYQAMLDAALKDD